VQNPFGMRGPSPENQRFFQKRRFLIRETLIFGGIMFCSTFFLVPNGNWVIWLVAAVSALAAGYFFAVVMYGLFGEPLQKFDEDEGDERFTP